MVTRYGSPAGRARWIACFALGALALAGPADAQQGDTMAGPIAAAPVSGPPSIADLADRLLPAVVNIATAQRIKLYRGPMIPHFPENSPFGQLFKKFFKDHGNGTNPLERIDSLGSGFIVSPDGYVVTNNHVIDGADDITVKLSDDRKLKAKIVGIDKKTDIAVLKVDSDRPLPFLRFGNSDRIRIGDWVMAIGNPFGLGGSVTVGIVSARNRNIHSGPYDDFIQTDAAINRGNSGGPLFDMHGDVIGINTAIISPSGGSIGIGFAIPSEIASLVIDQLEKYGQARRGWIGVRLQSLSSDVAASLTMNDTHGAMVAGLVPGGPADKAGLKPGDVIVRFDGHPVDRVRDLPRIVADSPVGNTIDAVVMRNGAETTVKIEIGLLKEADKLASAKPTPASTASDANATTRSLGLYTASLTPTLRSKFGIKDAINGVVITDVAPSGPAAEKRIVPGDVIVEVGQEPVVSPDDVVRRVDDLKKQERKTALLLIASGSGDLRFVALRIDG